MTTTTPYPTASLTDAPGRSPRPRRTFEDLAAQMGLEGYRVRFIPDSEGEAIVKTPRLTLHTASLTGATLPPGCSCPGYRHRSHCKHLTVLDHYRPCDEPGCRGTQEYAEEQTAGGGLLRVFRCLVCGKAIDASLVYEKRRHARSPQHEPQAA